MPQLAGAYTKRTNRVDYGQASGSMVFLLGHVSYLRSDTHKHLHLPQHGLSERASPGCKLSSSSSINKQQLHRPAAAPDNDVTMCACNTLHPRLWECSHSEQHLQQLLSLPIVLHIAGRLTVSWLSLHWAPVFMTTSVCGHYGFALCSTKYMQ